MAQTMTGDALTPRRRQILEFIERHTQKFGYPPTVREIGEGVQLSSPSTVHAHLKQLEKSGFIRREGMLTRAIRSVREQTASVDAGLVNVPIVGRVAAGQPILAEEHIDGYFGVPNDMVPEGRGFLLHVSGDSMVEAGIYDGDYVVVREQPSADNGDIVVAMMEGEGTVKRFYRENGHVRLQPENSRLKPIIARDVTVVGKVVGLFRRVN